MVALIVAFVAVMWLAYYDSWPAALLAASAGAVQAMLSTLLWRNSCD